MKVRDVVMCIESLMPTWLQENYDNCGLQVGNYDDEVKGILIALDCNENVINEALNKKCNLIITHHPLIFNPIKKISFESEIESLIAKAILEKINILSYHTNVDNSWYGLNMVAGKKLGLKEITILSPKKEILRKLVTFCPTEHIEKVRTAIFEAGAGYIGNYSDCSFSVQGKGSFRALDGANPFVGKIGERHYEDEIRIETIYPVFLENQIIKALLEAHPYEEVAYDIYPLTNEYNRGGIGIIGTLEQEMQIDEFLSLVKQTFNTKIIKYNHKYKKTIKKVAYCGGSGKMLINTAIKQNADAFISADFTYHDFINANDKILLVDAGHFETEQLVCELLTDVISEKFPNFAIYISDYHINPIEYF